MSTETQTALTENTAYTKTADVFGTGRKDHKVHTTEPAHFLRRTINRENGAWTMRGEYIVEGPRGAVYSTYRYSEYPDKLTLINEKTLQRVEYNHETIQPRSA